MLKRFVHYLNNKKSKVLLVGSLVLLFVSNLFGRGVGNNLYLIAGHIYVNIPGEYYSYLFKYNNQALDTVALLSNDSTQLKFIKAYHNQRKVVILKDGYIYDNDYILQVINMGNPSEKIGSLNMGDGNNLFEINLILYNDSLYYLFYKSGDYIGINIDDFNIKKFNNAQILTNTIIKGVVGGLMDISTDDYILLSHNEKGDSVYISLGYNKKIYLNFKIPDLFLSKEKRYYSIPTKNYNYIAIWNSSSEYNQNKNIGWSEIITLNNKNNKWDKIKLKGNIVTLINFKNWLCGWVTEGYDGNNGFEWISPGVKYRKKENNTLGSTFDERALDLDVYMPGILYLYNMDTKQYIEWSTGQGDSEILLMHDDYVYYRTADEIWKAPIIEGKKIGTPELIIKHEIIHDVHWAFISEK